MQQQGILHELCEKTQKMLSMKPDLSGHGNKLYKAIFLLYYRNTLNDLIKCLWDPDDRIIQNIKDFLKMHWERIKGTYCSYTALPQEELTKLLCAFAVFIGKELQEKPIRLLMPGIETESYHDDYPDLTALDLQEVLNTHISGAEGTCLIPVKKLIDAVACKFGAGGNNFYTHYYPHAGNVGSCSINEEEYARLVSHSGLSRAVHETAEAYYELEHSEQDLFSQLSRLCRVLRFNDAHGGIGTQNSAGEGAYLAIINFQDFFSKLTEADKTAIPAVLQTEIDLLIALSSDSHINRNATETLQTCIGTRRENLIQKMDGYEAQLKLIRLNGVMQSTIIRDAETHKQLALQTFVAHLEKKQYSGRDHLGIRANFLAWLQLEFNVKSRSEFDVLMRCSAQDIQVLIDSNQVLKNNIVAHFCSGNLLEELSIFLTEGHARIKVEMILGILAQRLDARKLSTIKDFSTLFLVLNTEQTALVCGLFKARLKKVIKNGMDFESFLKDLTPDQHKVIFQELQEHIIKDVIKTAQDFRCVLAYLTPEQRAVLYEAHKDQLKKLINTGTDFGDILLYLTDEQRTEVFDFCKQHLKDIINTGTHFRDFLAYLAPEQRTVVYEVFKGHLRDLISTAEHFSNFLTYLTPEQRTSAYEVFKESFKDIMKTGEDFREVLKQLNPKQCSELCTIHYQHLQKIAKSKRYFSEMHRSLSLEQRYAVYHALRDHLATVLIKGEDFGCLLGGFDIAQSISICELFKNIINPHYLSKIPFVLIEQRRWVHQWWFTNYLQEIHIEAKENNCIQLLLLDVQKRSIEFFNENYTPEGYKIFRKGCQDAINLIRPQLREKDAFLKKITLAILTVGIVPAIMAIHSKKTKDTFNFSFFATKEEKLIDNFMDDVALVCGTPFQ